jgi:predicted aspartyl protease
MWRLLCILLISACSSEPSGPCRLQLVADIPVALTQNGLEVTARVNRVDTQFILDTGAERTTLTTGTVTSLLLARSKLTASQLIGVGGAVSNADVFADLQLGPADFQQRFAVADIPRIGGLIGGDLLSDYDVEIDIPDRRVRLWRASTCGANDLPWSGSRAALPVHVTWGDRLVVALSLDGMPINALLDSGSSISLLPTEAARRIGVRATLGDPAMLVHGIDGGSISVRIHRFKFMSVGQDQIISPQIGIGESQLVSPEMILGLDYLRRWRIWIAFRAQKIFMQLALSRGAPLSGEGPTPSMRPASRASSGKMLVDAGSARQLSHPMCGRYASFLPAEAIARIFGTVNPSPTMAPSWTVAPT